MVLFNVLSSATSNATSAIGDWGKTITDTVSVTCVQLAGNPIFGQCFQMFLYLFGLFVLYEELKINVGLVKRHGIVYLLVLLVCYYFVWPTFWACYNGVDFMDA